VTRATPIGFLLLLLAMLLLPLDIAVRRLRFGKIRLARRPKPAAASDPLLGGLSAAKQRARRQTASPADAADPAPIAGAPVYRSAPEYRPPASPAAATQEVPAASPPAPPAPPAPTPTLAPPKAVDLDEISDPLERLRAAKNRARRR
jgi:hypothetical protein